MWLYLISQTTNTGYDTYDSAVVAAESEENAQSMHPSSEEEPYGGHSYGWTEPENVTVTLLGLAINIDKPRVICASFNAG